MTPFQNPTIYIGELRIDEPITTLTDVVFCIVCFFAFFKTKYLAQNKAIYFYRWFFLLTGVSTLVAAIIGHAFLYYFGKDAKIYGWVLGIFGVSFAQFAALFHTRQSINRTFFNLLMIVCSLEIVLSFVLVFMVWSFVIIELHTAFSLVMIVTILEYIHYKKTTSQLSLYMMYGVGVAILAVLCHLLKIAFSIWFNHIDLSHLFMALSMYLMYKAIKKFNSFGPPHFIAHQNP
jgi:hypothetical protein